MAHGIPRRESGDERWESWRKTLASHESPVISGHSSCSPHLVLPWKSSRLLAASFAERLSLRRKAEARACSVNAPSVGGGPATARIFPLTVAIFAAGFSVAAFASEPASQDPPNPRTSPNEIRKTLELRRAAEATGDPQIEFILGTCYDSGRGISRDMTQALQWFRKSADQGYDAAQYKLGCCYNGEGGYPRDTGKAVMWWGKAAAQGYADAQYCLGLSYFAGEGVGRSPSDAALWWARAAAQNHPDAQYYLGVSYFLGLGVPKAREQAIFWLGKALANGNVEASAILNDLK